MLPKWRDFLDEVLRHVAVGFGHHTLRHLDVELFHDWNGMKAFGMILDPFDIDLRKFLPFGRCK